MVPLLGPTNPTPPSRRDFLYSVIHDITGGRGIKWRSEDFEWRRVAETAHIRLFNGRERGMLLGDQQGFLVDAYWALVRDAIERHQGCFEIRGMGVGPFSMGWYPIKARSCHGKFRSPRLRKHFILYGRHRV